MNGTGRDGPTAERDGPTPEDRLEKIRRNIQALEAAGYGVYAKQLANPRVRPDDLKIIPNRG